MMGTSRADYTDITDHLSGIRVIRAIRGLRLGIVLEIPFVGVLETGLNSAKLVGGGSPASYRPCARPAHVAGLPAGAQARVHRLR